MVNTLLTNYACGSSSFPKFDFIFDFIKGFQIFKVIGNFIR